MEVTLFDLPIQPPSHRNAPRGTSAPAADSIRGAAAALRRQVFDLIAAAGERGLTDEEGQAASGLDGNTYRPRRWELERAGSVKDSGLRRKTRSGREAAVWVVKSE